LVGVGISNNIKEDSMLVLTRGLKQKIVIGDQLVTVTVLEVKGGRVRLGIEAPENMSIRRQELVIDNENEADSLHPCLH
jgi:carbon storage regulator